MESTIFGSSKNFIINLEYLTQSSNLNINLQILKKESLNFIFFTQRDVTSIDELTINFQDSIFNSISPYMSIEIVESTKTLKFILSYIPSYDNENPISRVNLSLSLNYTNFDNNFEYSFNNSILDKNIDLVELIHQNVDNIIESLPKRRRRSKEIFEDEQIINERKKTINKLKIFLDDNQIEFIDKNIDQLSYLNKEKIFELYEKMFDFQNNPHFVKYFNDCIKGEECSYKALGKCSFSHHLIQKRVFQTKKNGYSLEINSIQNTLLHLSILLNVTREQIIEIINLDIDEIFEIPVN